MNSEEECVVVIAPKNFKILDQEKTLFLAGGISKCPDWQKVITKLLKKGLKNHVFFNPRRKIFDVLDKSVTEEQIIWEYKALEKCASVLFWFCEETLCPITLYELGKISMTKKNLFVGCHPNYKRKDDVVIQTGLIRKDVKVVFSIEDLAKEVIKSLSTKGK